MTDQENAAANVHLNASRLKEYSNSKEAVKALRDIYAHSISLIEKSFKSLLENDLTATQPKEACYPYLGIYVSPSKLDTDVTLSYGTVDSPGVYGTTITRPDLFSDYLKEQIDLLLENYGGPVVVGLSNRQIPLHFANITEPPAQLTPQQLKQFKLGFVHPDLRLIDDEVVNHTFDSASLKLKPLALFDAERVDFSLHRLHHYTGTQAEHFQNFILITNYQRYVDEFAKFCKEQLEKNEGFEAFVEPGDIITYPPHSKEQGPFKESPKFLPQMPAYHLKKPDRNGITFINIGVGPTNAKNITDHLAVLRPHCWLIVGHCAGLRRSQILGDYVLAHGYVREDNVLDQDLPLWVPVPPIAEIQIALQDAVAAITGLKDHHLKTRMRTGTVITTNNRNWELRSKELHERINQSRAIALDMESATIAANGLRFRVPYGTLLCVSDKPVHGEIKMRNMANAFYESRVSQHLKIGLETIEILWQRGIKTLHSRKLRSFNEPPFR
jgi:AMP nucleosidase